MSLVLNDYKKKYSDALKSILIVSTCQEFNTNPHFSKKSMFFGTSVNKDKAREVYRELEKHIQALIGFANQKKSQSGQNLYSEEIDKLTFVQKKLCDCLIPGECNLSDLEYKEKTGQKEKLIETQQQQKEVVVSQKAKTDAEDLFKQISNIVANYKSKSLAEVESVQTELLRQMTEKQKQIINKPKSQEKKGIFGNIFGKDKSNDDTETKRLLDEMKIYSIGAQVTAVAADQMMMVGGRRRKTRRIRMKTQKKSRRH